MGPKGRAILVVVSVVALGASVFYVGWLRHAMADLELTLLLSEEGTHSYLGVQEVTSFGLGPQMQSRVEVHRKRNKERLEYLTGPAKGVVLIDDGERLWRLDPHDKTVGEFASERRPGRSALFLENYRARAHPGAEVAGRHCKGLRIEPDHHIGPTRILWYEPPPGEGTILKREDYNTSGRLASRFEFETIVYGRKVADSVFEVPPDYEVRKPPPEPEPVMLDDAEETVGFAPLIPSYVPDGYELDRTVALAPPWGHKTLVLEYFDGLNRIGVFEHMRGQHGEDAPGPEFGPPPDAEHRGEGQAPRGQRPGPRFGPPPDAGHREEGQAPRGQRPGPGPEARGPKPHRPGWLENRMAGAASSEVGEIRVVVIGDLPPEELQKIADSVK